MMTAANPRGAAGADTGLPKSGHSANPQGSPATDRAFFEMPLHGHWPRDSPFSRRPYESVLRRFQRFVGARAPGRPANVETVEAWLRERVKTSSLCMAIRRAQLVSRFLDWLVNGGRLPVNPISELRKESRRNSTAAIVRAVVGSEPMAALQKLRGLPRFGSHLGQAIREHVERMQNLGFR